jgi:hypothetical protein
VERYVDGVKKLAPTKDKDKWRAACKEADSALKLSKSERSKLIVNFPDDSDSDVECEDEEETEGLNLPFVYFVIVYIWSYS